METASVTIDLLDDKMRAAIQTLHDFHAALQDTKDPYHEAYFVDATNFADAYYGRKSEAIRQDKMCKLRYAHYTSPELRGNVIIMRVHFVFENEETDTAVLVLDPVIGSFYTAKEVINPLYPTESDNRTKLDMYKPALSASDLNCVNLDLYTAVNKAKELAELEELEKSLTR
jgi:hypothetical protein